MKAFCFFILAGFFAAPFAQAGIETHGGDDVSPLFVQRAGVILDLLRVRTTPVDTDLIRTALSKAQVLLVPSLFDPETGAKLPEKYQALLAWTTPGLVQLKDDPSHFWRKALPNPSSSNELIGHELLRLVPQYSQLDDGYHYSIDVLKLQLLNAAGDGTFSCSGTVENSGIFEGPAPKTVQFSFTTGGRTKRRDCLVLSNDTDVIETYSNPYAKEIDTISFQSVPETKARYESTSFCIGKADNVLEVWSASPKPSYGGNSLNSFTLQPIKGIKQSFKFQHQWLRKDEVGFQRAYYQVECRYQ